MRGSWFYLGTAFVSILCACSNLKNSHGIVPLTADAIINGQEIAETDAVSKNVVLIHNDVTNDICTGAILSEQFILTAAHCIDSVENLRLYFGTRFNIDDQFVPGAASARSILDAKVSDYWNARSGEDKNIGDIALIKFAGGLPTGYKPIVRMPDSENLYNGQTAYLLGYGLSNMETKTGAGNLRFGAIQIADVNFSETEVKLDQTHSKGACNGDSGGPVFALDQKNKLIFWGLISRAVDDPQNGCDRYSAVTSAQVYSGWIDESIRSMTAGDDGILRQTN